MSSSAELMIAGPAGTHLVPATHMHFDWAIAGVESEQAFDGLRLPPGGLDAASVLSWIKRTAQAVAEATQAHSAWIITSGSEAVGLISYKAAPVHGVVEIGYGVAASRRDCGHATRAVALLVREAAGDRLTLTAETASTNRASEIVLERNGFVRVGTRLDAEEGELVSWRREHAA